MKLITAGVTSAILVVGLAGSVAAYRTQVGEAEPVARPTAVRSVQKSPSEQPSTVRWAPCPDRARLERGVCVTDVVRTVVVPHSAPAQVPSPGPWAAGAAWSDDESEGGEDSGGEGHDDADDHGYDDHGEDDDD